MMSTQNGSANYYVAMTPLESRKVSQQELMQGVRAVMSQVPERRISVSGGTDISGASSGGGRAGRRRGREEPAVACSFRGRTSSSCRASTSRQLMETVKIRRSTASWTSTRTSNRRSRNCAVNVDRARAADLGVSHRLSWRRACARWSVARRSPSTRKATTSSRCGCGWTSVPERPEPMGESVVPAPAGGSCKVSDVAQLTLENAAGLDRPLQPPAPDLGQRNLDTDPAGRGGRRRPREGRGTEPESPDTRRRSAAARGRSSEASNDFVIAIILAIAFIYMVLASQFNSFIHPLTIMTALPLSLPAGLLALMAFGMTHQRVQRHRPDDAVRHREEELDSAGGLHQHAARAGNGAARGHDRGQPRPAAARS